MEVVDALLAQSPDHIGGIARAVHDGVMGVKAQLQLAVKLVQELEVILQTDIGLHGDLHAVVLGHLHSVLVHLVDVLVLGRTVHSHSLDHHHGDTHLTGGNDAVLDALHALPALRGVLAEADIALANQRIQVDGLQGDAVLGGSL